MAKDREPDAKWFDRALGAVGLSARQISLKIGTNYQILRRILNGERECGLGESLELARQLRAPWPVVVEKLGYEVPQTTVAVIGRVGPHGHVSLYPPGHAPPAVPAPPDTLEGLVSLRVEAPQSALAIFHGATLYYEQSAGVRPDAMGRLSIVELGDHVAPVVGVLERSAQLGSGRVTVWGSGEIIESRRLISATPVRWIRA